MKTLDEVSSDKLRGGYYTPTPLIEICLNRIVEFGQASKRLVVLEPSVGDGAFLRSLTTHPISNQIESFVGLEINPQEAQKCREFALDAPFEASIRTTSALEWAVTTDELYDVVVGNPPFVRFQFVNQSDFQDAATLGMLLGVPFRGVSNLWIPVTLGALNRLRPGGVMALVVPAELFTGLSAGDVRRWLLSNFEELRIDLFEPGSFPQVLQEVVIISGRKIDRQVTFPHSQTNVEFVEHSGSAGSERHWSQLILASVQSWTRYLLTTTQLEALSEVCNLANVKAFNTVAKLEVSIVTGANDFFSVNKTELELFELHQWAEPLLPRIRHASGLVYTNEDHRVTIEEGAKAWLLNFSEDRPDPRTFAGASKYLAIGEKLNLHKRYKTSIRTPWYRVPSVWPGKLMLSKRCHLYPRLVYNEAGVVTTDTIYRGQMLPQYAGRELDLVGTFHNSLTLLTAEIEGRSFGGGVLELVPSEIARLAVPLPLDVDVQADFQRLNCIAPQTAFNPQTQNGLIEETDALLARYLPGLNANHLHLLQQAREFLLKRRLSRN